MERKELLKLAIQAAFNAGDEILAIYKSDFTIEKKEDKTPLTQADKNAHSAILKILNKTQLPILSEEGKQIDYETRRNWKQFWMVDPLDGTREFIKRNGEFTVNIALIEDGNSNLGVVYVPVTSELYFADTTIGAFKIVLHQFSVETIDELIKKAQKLPSIHNRKNYIVVGSRSHMNEETEAFMKDVKSKYAEVDLISKGSSLKLCMVAEGSADCYPRFAPTMEWDTAAGQAIVIASEGIVMDWNTKQQMKYNKENLLNSWFLVERN